MSKYPTPRQFSDLLKIDERDLLKEVRRQPGLTLEAGMMEADAQYELAQAKLAFEVTEAKVQLEVRRAPAAFGLDDPKEASFKAAIMLDKRVQEAQKRVDEAKHYLGLVQAYVTGQTDRRRMIERHVDLMQIEYYSDREPRPRSQAGRKALSDGVREGMAEEAVGNRAGRTGSR